MACLRMVSWIMVVCLVLGCVVQEPPAASATTTVNHQVPVKRPPKATVAVQPNLKDFRDAKQNKDIEACAKISSQRLRDVCVRDIALDTDNMRACEKVVTESIKNACYFRMAVQRKDSSLCSSILDGRLKELCQAKSA